MQSDDVISQVRDHLDRGGEVELSVDKAGRRFVKLRRMVFFGPKYEIGGATEATIQNLLAAKRRQSRGK